MEANSNSASRCACRVFEFLESSIGKKIMVAAAGILLCGFLVAHLLGNMLLFVGADAFNHYAETLEHNILLPVAEVGLFLLFIVHIILSYRATYLNRKARPDGYQVYKSKGARTWGSRSMAITGTLVLAFLIVHIKTFKFGGGGADLYTHVVTWFANPLYASFYVLALGGLGLHLSHGVQSAFQTFGLNHPRYSPLIRKAGLVFAGFIFLGFASMPLYFGFFVGGSK
jgi:succinate dehydrogenase / fumarate reductase cytochrome b subunit